MAKWILPICRGRRSIALVLGLCTVSLLCLYFQALSSPPFSKSRHSSTGRYAYATFLCSRFDPNLPIEADIYLIATQVLGYQLLHHPTTRTTHNIPFVVLIPPHVPIAAEQILSSQGANVIRIPDLLPETWEPKPANSRWIDQFTKLRIFEVLGDYDRVLYLDSDMLITKRLDPIFDEPEVLSESLTGNISELFRPDEASTPSSFVLVGAADQEGPGGERPKPIHAETILNGGFFVFKPSLTLFEYYKSVLELGKFGRFNTNMMEMGLFNYAHRRSGNMPWTVLPPGKWNANWPSWKDYELGVASLHDKFWDPSNKEWIDQRLVDMWFAMKKDFINWKSKSRS